MAEVITTRSSHEKLGAISKRRRYKISGPIAVKKTFRKIVIPVLDSDDAIQVYREETAEEIYQKIVNKQPTTDREAQHLVWLAGKLNDGNSKKYIDAGCQHLGWLMPRRFYP